MELLFDNYLANVFIFYLLKKYRNEGTFPRFKLKSYSESSIKTTQKIVVNNKKVIEYLNNNLRIVLS